MFALTLVGKGASSLLPELEAAAIKYDRKMPLPGVVMNSGDLIEILKGAGGQIPWAAAAYVLVNWLKLRQSRKIIITKGDNTLVHLEGMTAKELEAVLPNCKTVMVMEAETQNESQQPSNDATHH